MKKDEFSFFEIFQDPLMTIIALVLLGTVWMIFPGTSKSNNPEVSEMRNENESLMQEVAVLEEKIEKLKAEHQKLSEMFSDMQKAIRNATQDSDENKQQVEIINKKIAVIENSIKGKV